MKKRNGFNFIEVLIVLVVIAICYLVIAPSFKNTETKLTDIRALAYVGYALGDSNYPGGYSFEVRQRYNCDLIRFFSSYDGVLRKVRVEADYKDWIEPNSPKWNAWLEIFKSIKAEATTGKRM